MMVDSAGLVIVGVAAATERVVVVIDRIGHKVINRVRLEAKRLRGK